MERFKIDTLNNKNRMSTQELLQLIQAKIEQGVTSFEINACGQHDIGGASYSRVKGENLKFFVKNPGQRLGAMGMKGTQIIVEGSVPADTGWLNSGAEIVVKGDCGDTAGHCSASGEIYVGGCVGARSGALMKHDPQFKTPELWVLKNTGSFSFEFMGGGIAVICGYGCEDMKSVLGERSCVGMVGGTVYVRGNISDVADCVEIKALDKEDIDFLNKGLQRFLEKIDKKDLLKSLTSNWSGWKKIQPVKDKKSEPRMSIKEFREKEWIEGGIFSDFMKDDYKVFELGGTGMARCRIPQHNSAECINCSLCEKKCPQKAISRVSGGYIADAEKCIGCGICAAVCPKKAWKMLENNKDL
ncbi:4Fe-4S binding protein [bacterium]|nr:4Fe-4S binding protein [bacterium]